MAEAMTRTLPPDDERLDPALLHMLLSALAADPPDAAAPAAGAAGSGVGAAGAAAVARSRRRLLRDIAAAQTQLVTVPPADDGFRPFVAGVRIKVLHEAGGVMSYLLRFAPGGALPPHRHPLDEACVVLEGALQIGPALVVPAGGFHLAPAGSLHAPVASRGGALIFLHGAVPEVADLI